MPTWREKFSELAAEQTTAMEAVKNAGNSSQMAAAIQDVKTTINTVSDFLKHFESMGMPDHDDEMPNN
jgi:hypothetical protein